MTAPLATRVRPTAAVSAGTLLAGVFLALTCAPCAAQAGHAELPAAAGTAPGEHALACDNEALTAYAGLLVLAPHPDDETIAFAGLTTAYMRAGKPVDVVVATDGDAYCDACRFWKSGSVRGATCSAAELSNFATAETDSFAEVRRGESAAAAAILGRQPPRFLGYPDTGLGAAWRNSRTGRLDARLRRSDFSACPDCESCPAGYAGGPETALTARTLADTLAGLLAAARPGTLVVTTHPLDGHGDHAALGNFVKILNDAREKPLPIAFAVVHAHTPKSTAHCDCWYPAPQALVCPCADEARASAEPGFVAALRAYRLRPESPAALPDDAPYGRERRLCLSDELYRGDGATKLAAVRAYGSQLGTTRRDGSHPPALDGLVDCNGYLLAFVRRTEAFVLAEPEACDPAGTWEGEGGGDAAPWPARLGLARTGESAVAGYLAGSEAATGGPQEVVTGEVGPRCTLTLRTPARPGALLRAAISRDGRSLYGTWEGAAPGFLVLHR
ncbi:MAG: PIG-L family deacetylase [Acidobacteria bacterium]|nr:PIG-L family deacetylase [Acidobacteriota bacterium]